MSTPQQQQPTTSVNCPRNLLVVGEPTQPIVYSFVGKYQLSHQLVIHQTPAEETWPGGALWDLGVLLSHVIVGLSLYKPNTNNYKTTANTHGNNGKSSHHHQNSKIRLKIKQTDKITIRDSRKEPLQPPPTMDIGVIVTLTTQQDQQFSSSSSPKTTQTRKCPLHLPHRLVENATLLSTLANAKIVLELGCGVGLTALALAVAFGIRLTVLTDLESVIDKVTTPNVQNNALPNTKQSFRKHSQTVRTPFTLPGNGKAVAIPLCWGKTEDEQLVTQVLCDLDTTKTTNKSRKTKKTVDSTHHVLGVPDVIVIGDVAYQHRPGAPSHFDSLVSTLLHFCQSHTLVVFGTRIRMPASVDLLDMLHQHFQEVVQPPIRAEEVDPTHFQSIKHNMTIHFLKLKTKENEK